VRNKRLLKPLAKKSVSTWPHVPTLREFLNDCKQRGVTESARLRQILDEYYSNERLKGIGRDVAETPIRRIQKEAISEELFPLKKTVAEIERGLQATRSTVEDILGRIAQLTLGAGSGFPEITAERASQLESVADRLAGYLEQLINRSSLIEGENVGNLPSFREELLNELSAIKSLTAKLALRSLKCAVLTAAKAELKSCHNLHVEWRPETGIEICAVVEVVKRVTNPETEIALADAQRRYGPEAQLGDKVRLRVFNRVDAVRIIAQAANEFLQRG
jgi:hypothetical protein